MNIKLKTKLDVLILVWSSNFSRDTTSSILISNYLEKKGLTVMVKSIFFGLYYIIKYRPKLVYINGGYGAIENYNIIKFSKLIGCSVVINTPEGNLWGDSNNIKEMIFGWNKKHNIIEDVNFQWSQRSMEYISQIDLLAKERFKLVGGVFFDIYKIFCVNRNQYKKINNYTKIIGVGLWDFGPFYENDTRNLEVLKYYSHAEIENHKKDRILFKEILENTIHNHKDILFILKTHPGSQLGNFASGIDFENTFENVLIVNNDLGVFETILISDFWLAYDSTTIMEAWLAKKETILINPTGRNFNRASINLGSMHVETYQDLSSTIECLYNNIPIDRNVEYQSKRKKIISDSIEWEDGNNHVRASNEIITSLNNNNIKKLNLKSRFIINLLSELLLNFISTKTFLPSYLKRFEFRFNNIKLFNEYEFINNKNTLKQMQERFYNNKEF